MVGWVVKVVGGWLVAVVAVVGGEGGWELKG